MHAAPIQQRENAWESLFTKRLIGQPAAAEAILPYLTLYSAGLSPEGRPAGVFLLLGPSGTGKTKTVEALAEILHGSEKNVLRIDCGEFQHDHETAKLIGAPPGYLGHRETKPQLTQEKLDSVMSTRKLSLVLFDEIEKSAPSLKALLLGVLDKASLKLGDNSDVNFERCMIFLTSNLGAREMLNCLKSTWGLPLPPTGEERTLAELEKIGMAAAKKALAPEFLNRIDKIVTYQPLSAAMIGDILDLELARIQTHIQSRLGARSFGLTYTKAAREFLVARGTSVEYGARELKRTLHRHVMTPLAHYVVSGEIPPLSIVRVDVSKDGLKLRFRIPPAVVARHAA